MRRILIIFVLFTILLNTYGQRNGIEYIRYDWVITDLTKNKTESIFYQDLNYEAMILLDKSCIQTLISVNPNFISETGIDTSLYNQQELVVNAQKIKTDIDDIIEFFEDEELFHFENNTHQNNQNGKLPLKIYIKQPDLAYYELKGESWGEAYFVKLENNELLITNIYRILESSGINE